MGGWVDAFNIYNAQPSARPAPLRSPDEELSFGALTNWETMFQELFTRFFPGIRDPPSLQATAMGFFLVLLSSH